MEIDSAMIGMAVFARITTSDSRGRSAGAVRYLELVPLCAIAGSGLDLFRANLACAACSCDS